MSNHQDEFDQSGLTQTCPSLCVERSHPRREHDPERDGCWCHELCSMGPTCPGANAGLDGGGCWRVEQPVARLRLHADAWLMQRIDRALAAAHHAGQEQAEVALDLVAFAEDVLARYAVGVAVPLAPSAEVDQ